MPDPRKKQIDPQPYLKHECQGRYMENGKPWSGDPLSNESLCMHCDVKNSCWAIKNGETAPASRVPPPPPEPAVPLIHPITDKRLEEILEDALTGHTTHPDDVLSLIVRLQEAEDPT